MGRHRRGGERRVATELLDTNDSHKQGVRNIPCEPLVWLVKGAVVATRTPLAAEEEEAQTGQRAWQNKRKALPAVLTCAVCS